MAQYLIFWKLEGSPTGLTGAKKLGTLRLPPICSSREGAAVVGVRELLRRLRGRTDRNTNQAGSAPS